MLDGEMLVERAMRIAQEAGLNPVFVALRADATFREAVVLCGCLPVVNEHADEGMAASIRAGVAAAQAVGAEGVVVMTCDQVRTRAEHLQLLCENPQRVCGTRYAGKTGIPAYFPASSFGDLLALSGDVGARALLREADAVLEEGLSLDVDTEEDVAAMLRLHRKRA
jgi:molybdenum cofactor cytidylyltransferase